MKTKTAILLATCLALSRPAGGIELSLEENRAQRGNIGYIDMRRLFKSYPETLRAKESFEELLRQAEEQVNLRKAEILRLRNDLSALKIEREFIAKTPLVISTAAAPAPATAPAASTVLPGFAAPVVSAAVSTAPAAAASPEPLIINIPGVSTAAIVVLPPSAAGPLGYAPAPLAAPAAAATPNPALAEIDARVAQKAGELAQKEALFKEYQAAAEKNLLDLESRKTEMLLGKIHRAVQEVARQEGVSVVVDKNSILYGHDAVDLTEKVLTRLKGS